MKLSADIELCTYRKIDRIDHTQWDQMTGDNPMAGTGWLRAVELTFNGRLRPLYVTAESSSGHLLGAAVCYIADKGPVIGDFDHMVLGRLKKPAHRLGLSFMPLLVCCPLYAYGRHILLSGAVEGERKQILVAAVLDHIEKEARSRSLALAFTNITSNERLLIQELEARHYLHAHDLPQSCLDIPWETFDDYLLDLKRHGKHMRDNVKKEMNRLKRKGVDIRPITDPSAVGPRLLALLDLNSRRHNGVPFMFNRDFFATLQDCMGTMVEIYGAFRGDDLHGVSIQLSSRTEGHVAFVGVDHAAAGNDHSYFNLFFYEPIGRAIAKGQKHLYFDRLMYPAKRRRGCRFIDTWFFYKPHRKNRGLLTTIWFGILTRWNRRIGPVAEQ